MLIELKTDLLLVKHFRMIDAHEPTGNHIYELWMIPTTAPELKQRIYRFAGPRVEVRRECERAVDETTAALMEEGLSLPVLWMNNTDEISVVEE